MTITELEERVRQIEQDLKVLKEAAQEHVKEIQARYRLALKKAKASRNVEEKSGKLWHVILTLYWEWQERRYRKQLVEAKYRSRKKAKSKPPSSSPDEDPSKPPQPYIRGTETIPKGTLS